MKLTSWFLNPDFSGRARRSHYWKNLAAWVGVALIAGIFITATGAPGDKPGPMTPVHGTLIAIIVIAASIDNLAMVYRRAHDTGRSGWVWLLLLIPLVNLLPFYWLMIQDSDQGPNKYGPPVKEFYVAPA